MATRQSLDRFVLCGDNTIVLAAVARVVIMGDNDKDYLGHLGNDNDKDHLGSPIFKTLGRSTKICCVQMLQ